MQILTKISGKSKDYLPLLDMINQGVQVKSDSVEKHLANEKLVTFLEQDIRRTGLEKFSSIINKIRKKDTVSASR